ncbi:DUF2057 domain-containing protein [Shewanella bicestrii]|uniref:DUF2057 domain-containing protein n=1 Tax=Shewanella bicestrii TaxID=2018305 RepID=A0A220UP76_9GAMM|nr:MULTISPECIES: DUF2057 domain-containing protein [Shewanella]ASK69672.1 DUF2057 domain-containing protein [Shewanella bicestrii]MDH0448214.1 DUF2057 domain-containing protein [Shewanella sp. GD04112]VEE63800.1 Uncharacterized protein conserved in bacteria (DUF2057) [Shewanella putrefaciens]
MKSPSILCASAILLASLQPVSAEVLLQLPSDVELLTVNGQKPLSTSPVTLSDGLNQIAFRYNAQYRKQANSVRYQSDVLIIRFNETDQALQLKLPNIDSAKAAKQFDESPSITLLDKHNQAISFDQDRLVKNGLQIGRNFEQEIFQYNQGQHPASIRFAAPQVSAATSAPTLPATTSAPSTAVTISTAASTAAITQGAAPESPTQTEISHMLDYWYHLADDATKAKFKAKINGQ